MRGRVFLLTVLLLLWGFGAAVNDLDARSAEEGKQTEQATGDFRGSKTGNLESSSPELEALLNDGFEAARSGDASRALARANQGLELAKKANDSRMTGMFLTTIGLACQRLGQYERALEYDRQAVAVHRETRNRVWEGFTLNDVGMVYSSLGQYDKALKYLDQAVSILGETRKRRWESNALTNTGKVYYRLGQYDKALDYFQQALTIQKELENRGQQSLRGMGRKDGGGSQKQGRNRVPEGNTLSTIGLVYYRLGQYEKALDYYRQALPIHQEAGFQWGQAMDLVFIGQVCRTLGRNDKAGEPLNEALKIARATKAAEPLWRALWNLGETEARQGASAAAIAHYEQALDTIEGMRAELSEKAVQTSFMKDKLGVYDRFITLLAGLHKKDPAAGYDRKSLEIFERKQGRVFLEEMGQSGARQFAGIPADVLARETELDDRLDKLQSALLDQGSDSSDDEGPDQTVPAGDGIQQVKAAQEALREEIKNNYPDYYALKYPRPAGLAELQQTVLQPGEVMLVYGVMDQGTYLWGIDREHFQLFSIGTGRQEFQEKVNEFRNDLLAILTAVERQYSDARLGQVARSSMADLRVRGRELHDLLFPEGAVKMISGAKTLYIVPSGPLYVLPFEALTAPANAAVREAHFLLEEHPVAYLSSASLLKVLREGEARKTGKPKKPLLAFANPVYRAGKQAPSRQGPGPDDFGKRGAVEGASALKDMRSLAYRDILGGSFPELPDTEIEAKKIKAILEAPDQSQPLQLREAASRSNVFRFNDEKRLSDYRYVVFACHGVLPGELDEVRQPALVLSDPDPGTGQEGFLTMADVFGLKLNADLVTLSACNTGRGEMQEGEGVIGLTRAFMYAGTTAISVTLWSVESKSAATLSTGLFTNLKAGRTRAEALRDAKLRLVRGEEGELSRHPFFWAPLVMFGDGK